MTIETSTAKAGPYAGAGLIGPFPVTFRFLDNAHLTVVQKDATGVETTLTLNVDFTASGAGNVNGGTVTLLVALPAGQSLTILRTVPITQLLDYTQSDSFPANAHEDGLDKLTMIAQQQQDGINGSIRVPETTQPLPALPPAAARVGTALVFDLNGAPAIGAPLPAASYQFGVPFNDQFVPTGGTTYALTTSPGLLRNLQVWVGGVKQRNGVDYTWSPAAPLTLVSTTIWPGDAVVEVLYTQALPIGFSDASVVGYDAAVTYPVGSAGKALGTQAAALQSLKTRDVWSADFGHLPGASAATNDAAILAAMTAVYNAGGGTVNIGYGTFDHDTIPFAWGAGRGVNIVGRGRKATVLRKAGVTTSPVLDLAVNTAAYSGLSIFSHFSDFSILGNGLCPGLRTTTMATFDVARIEMLGVTIGWDNRGSLIIGASDISVNGTGVAACIGYQQAAVGAIYPNAIIWYGQNTFIACSQWGMNLLSGYQNTLLNVNVEFCGTAGNLSTGGIQFGANMAAEIGYSQWVLKNVHVESNLGWSMKIAASNMDLTLDSCTILSPEAHNSLLDAGIGHLKMINMVAATPGDTITTAAARLTVIGSKINVLVNNAAAWVYENVLLNVTLFKLATGGTGKDAASLNGVNFAQTVAVPGSGSVTTGVPIATAASIGGCEVTISGAESISGVAFIRKYILAIKLGGGGGADIAATQIGTAGNATPTFTFDNNGGFLRITAGTASNGFARLYAH